MGFVFEVKTVESSTDLQIGDIVDVYLEEKIMPQGKGPPWLRARRKRIDEIQTKMPRTNYIHVTPVPEDVTLQDARMFLESVYNDPAPGKEDDPHSGRIKHERRWFHDPVSKAQGERLNGTKTWDQLMDELIDKETGKSASQSAVGKR